MNIQVTNPPAVITNINEDETEVVISIEQPVVDVIEVSTGIPGPKGDTGSKGDKGDPGELLITEIDKTYVHHQAVPSAVWTITHNLDMYPNITIIDSAGREVEGTPQYLDRNTVRMTFSAAFGGEAYLS